MPRKIIAALLAFAPLALSGQNKKVEMTTSGIMQFPRTGVLNVDEIKEDYFPKLQYLEMPKPGTNAYYDYLQDIKSKITPQPSAERESGQRDVLNAPVIGRQFEGNAFGLGAPNDNDMAISNDGYVVSVINSTINFFDNTGKKLKDVSLQAFGDTLKLTAHKYDPRALYDPEADRFVVAYLSGSNDSTNNIVLAFSRTNDPMKGWNFYALPGEPLHDTTWSDYPIITLTRDELIVTVNALQNNKSWQEGFKQSYIWQIDKKDGYDGTAIDTRLHHGIKYDGRPIRNLCPVQGGAELLSGTKYFLSNRNFAPENDTVFMIALSGNVSDPSHTIDVLALKSETSTYGVPPLAKQPSTHTLETNDARVLDAFVQNGLVQFAGNSVNKSTGRAAIFHGTITTYTAVPHLRIKVLSHEYLEYGYPALAYAGDDASDDDAIIFVNHSSDTVAPGNSAILYKNGEYSELKRLKSGSSYVNVISGKSDRWGDYSAAQRKYNELGVVWVTGSYGYRRNSFERLNGTWISEIKNPYVSQVGMPEANRVQGSLKVYPSPAQEYEPVVIEFEARNSGYADFRIYDMSGKAVHHLLTQKMQAGANRFSFVPGPLKPGTYILHITQIGGVVAEKKFVVE